MGLSIYSVGIFIDPMVQDSIAAGFLHLGGQREC